jgi:hypothetical protein
MEASSHTPSIHFTFAMLFRDMAIRLDGGGPK